MLEDKMVSVCIPAFNAEDYINDALISLLNQSYNNIEIIILDDCSTDNTVEIINSYLSLFNDIKFIKNDINIGYLESFNKLLSHTNGEYICFLDADDWISKDKILLQVEFLNKNKDIGAVGTSIQRADRNGRLLNIEKYPKTNDEIVNYFHEKQDVCFCGSSLMIRKSTLDAVGGYNNFFKDCPGEDYDWILRMSLVTKLANIDEVLYFYRFSENSLTRKVYYDVKQRYINDIIFYLYNKRKELGYDPLISDLEGVDNYICNLNRKESNFNIFYSASIQHAINGDYKLSISDYFKTFKYGRNYSLNIKNIFLIVMILIIPNAILLKLKSIFKVKNVSKI